MKRASEFRKWLRKENMNLPMWCATLEGTKAIRKAFNAGLRAGRKPKGIK